MSADTQTLAERTPKDSVFYILYAPRAVPAPPKEKKPKVTPPTSAHMAITALEDPEERKARQQSARKAIDCRGRPCVDLAPKTKQSISIGSASDDDKTRMIIGKRNSARSQ